MDLDDLPLPALTVCRSTISQTTACRAQLDNALAVAARISNSKFDAACMRLSNFSEATIGECSFLQTSLEGSTWRRTVVSRSVFAGCSLFHADLRGAHFLDCDFRDSDIQGFPDVPIVGATFTRCDLRRSCWQGRVLEGVSFVDCKFHGVYGLPKGIESVSFEHIDLSPDGDNTRLVTRNDLISHWGVELR
jgi:uncharacterized protein YjbI with pentapeptide repeats